MFKLSKKTEYALLALQHMAEQGEGYILTVKEIAEAKSVPQPLLAKILQQLAKEGLIDSLQGAYGGYILNRKPQEITLGEIVEAIEGPIRIVECIDEPQSCARDINCGVKKSFNPLQQAVSAYLQRVTLADVAASNSYKESL
ncbi:MAG: Rrf2 family transcriptional regulator [candidate division KSB1 bacterium]|nr:Rrf2 family transcriptional regulator [candidate division KSB1 bacterium]